MRRLLRKLVSRARQGDNAPREVDDDGFAAVAVSET